MLLAGGVVVEGDEVLVAVRAPAAGVVLLVVKRRNRRREAATEAGEDARTEVSDRPGPAARPPDTGSRQVVARGSGANVCRSQRRREASSG